MTKLGAVNFLLQQCCQRWNKRVQFLESGKVFTSTIWVVKFSLAPFCLNCKSCVGKLKIKSSHFINNKLKNFSWSEEIYTNLWYLCIAASVLTGASNVWALVTPLLWFMSKTLYKYLNSNVKDKYCTNCRDMSSSCSSHIIPRMLTMQHHQLLVSKWCFEPAWRA